jgi:hypothetical protein
VRTACPAASVDQVKDRPDGHALGTTGRLGHHGVQRAVEQLLGALQVLQDARLGLAV